MTQKVDDLVTPFSSMTYEERLELIRKIRKGRTVDRPAAARKRAEVVVKPVKTTIKKKLDKLDPEVRRLLLEQLQQEGLK